MFDTATPVRYLVARERKPMSDDEADIICIRALLNLGPLHDTAAAVRVLYEQGREAFEKMRDGK